MFGYVLPVKSEMKIRDFEAYRSLYCGVCKQLGRSFNVFSRLLLNYDLVLLALVADALSGQRGSVRCEGCFVNPFSKRCTLHGTAGLEAAADGLIMLSHHKLLDNLADESLPKRLGYGALSPFSRLMYKKAAARRPALDEVFCRAMQDQQRLEQAGCTSVDEAADPTARMCAALFESVAPDEEQAKALHRLGLFCGQIVYLLDAAEDYEKDAKRGRYNVFLRMGRTREQAVELTQTRCRMAAGEVALCYNVLDIKQYKPILDNIFYLGLPAGINAAGEKRTQRRTGHGHIQSI